MSFNLVCVCLLLLFIHGECRDCCREEPSFRELLVGNGLIQVIHGHFGIVCLLQPGLHSNLKYLGARGCSFMQVTKTICSLILRELLNNLGIWGEGNAQTFRTVLQFALVEILNTLVKGKKKSLKWKQMSLYSPRLR